MDGTIGSARALADPASHTTVRTVPYTAVRGESDEVGVPALVCLQEAEEPEFVEMAVGERLMDPGYA